MLGNALYRAGDTQKAEQAYRRLIGVQPSNGLAHYSLGMVLKERGQLDRARAAFEMAMRVDPAVTRATDRLAEMENLQVRDRPEERPSDNSPNLGGVAAGPSSDDEIRLTAGSLLAEGSRNLGSFLAQYLLAALMVLVGIISSAFYRTGSLHWFAERPPFQWPSVRFLRTTFELTGQESHGRELIDAVQNAGAWSDRLDILIRGVGIGLILFGGVLSVHAALAARASVYQIYERRLDVRKGVLSRRHQSVWLYEITDVELRQSPTLTVTRNAEIRIYLPSTGYNKVRLRKDRSRVRIIGFGSLGNQRNLHSELVEAALKERRAMRRWYL